MVGTDEYRCVVSGAWKLWSRPRTEWTPTITGITGGLANGGCFVTVVGGVPYYEINLNCTGTLTGSSLRVSGLPIGITQGPWGAVIGATTLTANGIRYPGTLVRFSSATEVAIFQTTGTIGTEITPTVPNTWVSKVGAISAHFMALAAG